MAEEKGERKYDTTQNADPGSQEAWESRPGVRVSGPYGRKSERQHEQTKINDHQGSEQNRAYDFLNLYAHLD